MGKLKDHFHEEICARAQNEPPEPDMPDDIEMLAIDAERATGRLLEALKKREEQRGSH